MSAESFARTSMSRARAQVIWVLPAMLVVLSPIGLWAAHLQLPALVGLGILALGVVMYASLRAPQAAVALVALSAIFDRYFVAALLPTQLGTAAHLTSEFLLGTVAIALTWQAWRARDLWDALRHPATGFFVAFVILAAVSAVINTVRPIQAIAGLLFTLDAVVLFYLVRMAHFDLRAVRIALGGFVALVTGAALISIAQVVMRPDVFGLTALVGRFGETYRVASIFGDPNVFGALISASVPFAIVAATRAPQRLERRVALAISLILSLALWLSFSRGGWLGMLVGFGITAVILDKRAFLTGASVLIGGLILAVVIPRGLAASPTAGTTDPKTAVLPATSPNAGGQSAPKASGLLASTVDRIGTVASGRDLRTLFVLNALPIVADHPALGVGPGEYGGAAADMFGTPVYGRYGTDRLFHGPQRTVDNFWLHLTVEGGLIGVVAFIGAIGVVLLPVFQTARRSTSWRRVVLVGTAAAAAALIVNSVTTMLLESNSVAFVFWLLLGFGSVIAAAPAGESIGGGAATPSVP